MTALQKTSLASLVVGLVLAAFIVPPTLRSIRQETDAMVAQQKALTAESAVPAPTPEQVAASLAAQNAQTQLVTAQAALAQARAEEIRAAAAKAAVPAAPAPKPVPYVEPAHSYVPSGVKPSGTVYGNPAADQSKPHVIVDFSPKAAASLDWKAAVASKRCAAYSFQPKPGVTVDRLYCDGVLAR